MIGIKKQTQWYIDQAKAIDIARRKLDPMYDMICAVTENMNKSFENQVWTGIVGKYQNIEFICMGVPITGLTHVSYSEKTPPPYNVESVIRTKH